MIKHDSKKTIGLHVGEIKLQRETKQFGYLIKSVIHRPCRTPIANVFNKDSYLSASTARINEQTIFVVQAIGKPPSDKLHDFMTATELALDREITKYKLMLDIDKDYKLHPNHPLIHPRVSV